MVNSISSLGASVFSSLFGTSTDTSTTTTVSVDSGLLTAWAAAKAGIVTDIVEVGADKNAPTPPWTPGYTPSDSALAAAALAGKAFFDPKAALYADLKMADDYRQLFALYQGLETLGALAGAASADNLSKVQLARIQEAFARGLGEFKGYLDAASFEALRVVAGDRVDSSVSTLGIARATDEYLTGVIVKGSLTSSVPGLAKDASFEIVAKTAAGTEKRVTIDLAAMGSIPRSLGNVVSFMNNRLSAAGVVTRIETVNLAPKTKQVKVGSQTVERAYTGPGEWALRVRPQAGEKISFASSTTKPAFYVTGQTASGGKLIKLEDTDGALGQRSWLSRPDATLDPLGALLGGGFLGVGEPYQSAPAAASEFRTGALMNDGELITEQLLRAAGEAVLKVRLDDGRTFTISTAWRADAQEGWRVRAGETSDQGLLDDLAERLTQLLHEQGISAGIDSWSDEERTGLSLLAADGVSFDSLTISGRDIYLAPGREPLGGYVGGLRAGIFARSFETGIIGDVGNLFKGSQTITLTGADGPVSVLVDGGEEGIDAETLVAKLNEKLRAKNLPAAVSIVENAGKLSLRVDTIHAYSAVDARINEKAYATTLTPPGAWTNGGLPSATADEPFGANLRTCARVGASPFVTETGAISLSIVIATSAGDKSVNVEVSAQERADNPDAAPGVWAEIFQQRLDTALYEAGVYVDSVGGDLSEFVVAEGTGQRIKSVSVNGVAVAYAATETSFGVGGAFGAQRSFTSQEVGPGPDDELQSLIDDPTVSITFDSTWGATTVSVALQPGDARTLSMAAQRLNEALAAAGYDLGVAAVDLSAGGAGLRAVSGASSTISRVTAIGLGGQGAALTLDPIDSLSRADDPPGTLSVAQRASRGAAITQTIPNPGTAIYQSPAANATNWFAGRDFELTLGQGAQVLATRATATAADGSVYVLADIAGTAGDQPVKGARDVALFKYDSAGKLLFARTLGAASEAEGYALAVSSDGKVAVAGSVSGGLSGAGTAAGGSDSFVSLFDSNGVELWTQRRGASKDDAVQNISFAANGAVIVSGITSSAMQGQTAKGGVDAYVRGYSAAGAVLFTHQFGTSGDDSAGALLVREGAGGAIDIFTGGVENNRGVVRAFSYSGSSGFSIGATRDLGAFYGGAITSLASDGDALYVGGAVGADRLTVANVVRGAVAGKEGFVARIDDDLTSAALDRATYLGSAADDSVTGLVFAGGALYALGQSGGVIAGVGSAKTSSAFLTRIGDDGLADWTRTFQAGAVTSLAVSQSGASALDRLGLPLGDLRVDDKTALVARSSLRVGDQFAIGSADGVMRKITISASDTPQSLAARIGSAIGSAGAARVVRENGVDRVVITPQSGKAVRIEAGPADKNALSGLGLVEGVVAEKARGRGVVRTFGLGLVSGELSLKDADAIKKARTELSAASSIIRQAYEALAHPNAREETEEERTRQAKLKGAVPTYLTDRLANYKAALSRLGG